MQREDLSDLSDSESGQDGPKRDFEQEVHPRPEAALWGGRYYKISQCCLVLVKVVAKCFIMSAINH